MFLRKNMFLDFYRLNDQPFGVTPDPKYLFWSRSHREALSSLYYGIESGCGFMTLIAPPGMGKTTLLFHLLENLRDSSRTAYLFHTQCNSREFLRFMMIDLGWDTAEQDTVAMYGRLYEILLAEARANRRFVLVIDEAQNLNDSVLETVRLLSNFETPTRKLMQVILAGQPQLAAKLGQHELWQLRQRISIMSRLEPLSLAEVAEYVKHRCKVAGYDGAPLSTEEARIDTWSSLSRESAPLFTTEALDLIASMSKGIPREVNNLCFNALSLGFAEHKRTIDTAIVKQVISDLELEKCAGLEVAPNTHAEPQDLSEAQVQPPELLPAANPSPDASPGEVKPSFTSTVPPAMDWIERNGGSHQDIRPLMGRIVNRTSLGVAASLAFLALAGYLSNRIRFLMSRRVSRRSLGVAASLAFLVLAGSLSIITLDRKTPEEPETTVHAASSPPREKPTPVLTENPNPARLEIMLDDSSPDRFMGMITLTVAPDANLDYLSRKYLGRKLDQRTVNEILLRNPQITDPNKIRSGSLILLPLMESGIGVSITSPKQGTRDERSLQENPPGR